MNLKDYIIKNIDQKTIFSKYFGISLEDIRLCIVYNSKISNPLRSDKKASLSFKYYGEKLVSRDFGDNNYSGDIFNVVGSIINKNCHNSQEFIDICNHIIKTCGSKTDNLSFKQREIKEVTKRNTVISFQSRNPNKHNYLFYEEFGIDRKTFNDNIFVVDCYYVNGKRSDYRYKNNNPCYAYNINPDRVKLYFPLRTHQENRFVSNNRIPIERINEIKESKNTIIIKSIKDKLLFDRIIKEKNITDLQVISVSSESAVITEKIYNFLLNNTKSKIIYSLFDNDNTGINNMFRLKEDWNIEPIYFTLNFDAKDPTDMVKKYGYEKVFNHFDTALKKLL